MSEDDLGRISILGDEAEVRLTRTFDHPEQVVWAALTAPSRVPEWLAPGTVTQALGGAVKLDFVDSGIVIDSRVSAFVPGRLIEYSWSQPGEPLRPVRWELEKVGCGTRLNLTLTLPASEDIARSAAGWEAHLEMLAASLEGVPIKFPFERFKSTREAYKAQLAG
ncbi:MAG TPA: SRPBCC family protein [Phenylobacterium sp.]|nr:SRPBCC family protein [Phenylobacterium sp.]